MRKNPLYILHYITKAAIVKTFEKPQKIKLQILCLPTSLYFRNLNNVRSRTLFFSQVWFLSSKTKTIFSVTQVKNPIILQPKLFKISLLEKFFVTFLHNSRLLWYKANI